MKKMLIFFVLVLLLSGAAFYACSNDMKAELEKGTIEIMTDTAAKESVDRIRNPIEKAHSAKNQQADRFRIVEETLKK